MAPGLAPETQEFNFTPPLSTTASHVERRSELFVNEPTKDVSPPLATASFVERRSELLFGKLAPESTPVGRAGDERRVESVMTSGVDHVAGAQRPSIETGLGRADAELHEGSTWTGVEHQRSGSTFVWRWPSEWRSTGLEM